MADEVLVESRLLEASKLVEALDAAGASPSVVAWYYFDDLEEWRLLLCGPSIDIHLPTKAQLAYREIGDAMERASVSSLSIGEVKLVRTDDPLVNTIRAIVRTPALALSRAHFVNNFLNGVFVKEMIVLRSA